MTQQTMGKTVAKFKCAACGAEGTMFIPKTDHAVMMPCPSCQNQVELVTKLTSPEAKRQAERRAGVGISVLKIVLGGIGLWFCRGVIGTTIVLSGQFKQYVFLPNPPPDGALTWDMIAKVLLFGGIIFGIVVLVCIAVASIQSLLQGLNGVRLVNGNGEAVKGIAFKLPDGLLNRRDFLKARAKRAEATLKQTASELATTEDVESSAGRAAARDSK